MKIDRNNYEAWFIDYLEGTLDKNQIDDFIEFIQQNPDLKEELSLFEIIPIVPESLVFDGKQTLYKNKYDHENEFSQAAIGRLEGDLTPEADEDFEKYLSLHPGKRKEADLFLKTRITPDPSVVYPKRKSLYHQSRQKIILLWTTGIAAVLILAMAIFSLTEKPTSRYMIKNQLAETEVIKEKNKSNPAVVLPEENKNKTKTPENKEPEKQQPAGKKSETGSEAPKSLRENSRGRLENNEVAVRRTPEEVPAPLKSLVPSISVPSPVLSLAAMNTTLPVQEVSVAGERLFADVIAEKTGLKHLSLHKVTKAGLSLFSNLSGEKFTFQTDEEGKVTELNYDSRLLAFTIPTSDEQ